MDNVRCKICDSQDIVPNFSNDDRILKCKNCGIIFLSPALVMEKPGDYYSDRFVAEKYTNESTKRSLRDNSRVALALIKEFKPKGSLLDIGTNIGMFVDEANKGGYKAMGIEPSRNLVIQAKQLAIPVISSTIEKFQPDTAFDIITMFHVLEHITEPLKALGRIDSMQAANGLLVLEVPNIESYMAKKDGISWKFIALEHLFYFSPKSISKFLDKAGYKIMKIKKRNFELNQLSIGKLLKYIAGARSDRNRFFVKNESGEKILPVDRALLKKIARKLLLFLIKLLGREDHILIIARKK